MDLATLREPVEVYEAAAGKPERLAKRIESGAEMHEWERAALAALVRGELVEPERKPGQSTLPHLDYGTKKALYKKRIVNSALKLEYYKKRLRALGKLYGKSKDIEEHVAMQDGLSHSEKESVLNHIKRSKKSKKRTDNSKDYPDSSRKKRIVQHYQRWLLDTGRLPKFSQPLDFFERYNSLYPQRALDKGTADSPCEED